MDALLVGQRKRLVCAQHGLVGVFPGDYTNPDLTDSSPDQGFDISRAMEKLMRGCDALIADITPFQGPSADVGTAFEMGFMRALGKPIFAYSNDARLFSERVDAFWGGESRSRPTGEREAPDGMIIENFRLADNLMLIGAVFNSGGYLSVQNTRLEENDTDLSAFVRCVQEATQRLKAVPQSAER